MLGQGLSKERVEVLGRERFVSERMSAKAPIRHVDLSLLFVSLTLTGFGALAIYSATRRRQVVLEDDPHFFLKRQLIFLALASIAFLVTVLFDYRQLRGFAPILYGAGILMLLMVLTPLGHSTAGAQRWLNLYVLQVQPSELMKIILIVALASLYADERKDSESKLPVALLMTAVPTLLIYFQPDLGTLMVLGAVLIVTVMVSGTRARWLLLLALGGIVAFVAVLNLGLLKDYQVDRLTALLDPERDPQRAGYNAAQSQIAVAAGGVSGKGLFQGTQTNLDFVPEQHTDFIFTAIAEEAGFVGAVVTLGLFAFLIWRALRIAMLSKDDFGMLLGSGIAGMFAFQMFVNVGMTVGIMPITGIPLPFLSYGGSSLITSFVAVALLMNIHMRRFI